MVDVLERLPNFEWRGRKYPLAARHVSFQHESIDHVLQYSDFEVIEQTGARGLTFSYTIPMRQGIAKGPYRDLFTSGLPVLFEDIRNREPGPLVDPVYGRFTCVPRQYDDETDVTKRDGTEVRVDFRLHREIDEDEQIQAPTLQGIASDAGALDADSARAEWQQEPPPEALTDILSAINGLASVPGRTIDKVSGRMHDLAFRLEKIETTVDRTTDPKNWPLRNSARRVRAATTEVVTTTIRVLNVAKTLTVLAAELGLTVADLLAANPQLARNPVAPQGTRVRVPARA